MVNIITYHDVTATGKHKGLGEIPLPTSEMQDCSGLCHLKNGTENNKHRGSKW